MKMKNLLLYEMANIQKQYTGLDHDIWVFGNTEEKHNLPRIKILVNGRRIPVSIESEPRILIKNKPKIKMDKIKEFIKVNEKLLLKLWKDNDQVYFIKNLKKI